MGKAHSILIAYEGEDLRTCHVQILASAIENKQQRTDGAGRMPVGALGGRAVQRCLTLLRHTNLAVKHVTLLRFLTVQPLVQEAPSLRFTTEATPAFLSVAPQDGTHVCGWPSVQYIPPPGPCFHCPLLFYLCLYFIQRE